MIIVGQKELYDWLESGVICGNESKTLSLWIDEAGGGIVELSVYIEYKVMLYNYSKHVRSRLTSNVTYCDNA